MAYATQEDVFELVEELMVGLFRDFGPGWSVPTPFVRIPLTIVEVSDLFGASGFQLFDGIIESGGVVRGLATPGVASRPRSFFDGLQAFAQQQGAAGLAWLARTSDGFTGPVASTMGTGLVERLVTRLARGLPGSPSVMPEGAALFLLAGDRAEVTRWAGLLRLQLGRQLELDESEAYRFAWITDFPLYELDQETRQITFSHNPFSMPQGGLEALQSLPPLQVRAWQYDIVCNGVELSSGAVRNHRPDIMRLAFEIGGYEPDQVEAEFGALLRAFRSGCPPHAGIGPGLERIVMLLANVPNLREVTPFPKDSRGRDLMMDAPSMVASAQLRDLGLALK